MYIFEVRYNDVYKFYFTYDRFVILSLRNNRDRLERRRRKKKVEQCQDQNLPRRKIDQNLDHAVVHMRVEKKCT